MKKKISRPDAETGTTTAKETKRKWIYIYQYEDSNGTVGRIVDEYPTKEEAYEAMKNTYDRCQSMNRCFGYENPLAYITDDSARTNESSGNTVKLWIKKKTAKMSWLKNAQTMDDIEREGAEKLAAELAKQLGIEGGLDIKKINEMINGMNNKK
jgi:hypothetical protein